MNQIEWNTVDYFVKIMLEAEVPYNKIIQLSRNMVLLFGVDSELEAELAVRECFFKLREVNDGC